MIDTGHFHSSKLQKWLPFRNLDGKPVKKVKIDPQKNGHMVEKTKRDVSEGLSENEMIE